MSSDSSWKYINVRRLFIYIEESIRANTNWAVFEPNDEILWSRVQGTITMFLTTLWRDGALAGSTPDEAFFVNIGKSTMTQDDILNGRMICEIGAAPVRPAEFIIFTIIQKMEDAS
ncbi:phage tail sheath C-terminal domain-containing protein [Amedibacillus sp. YH-ame6]